MKSRIYCTNPKTGELYGYLLTIVVDVFHPAVLSFIQRRAADVGRNRESLCRFRGLGA